MTAGRRVHLPPGGSRSAPTEWCFRRTFSRENDARSRHISAGAANSAISGRWRTPPPPCTARHQHFQHDTFVWFYAPLAAKVTLNFVFFIFAGLNPTGCKELKIGALSLLLVLSITENLALVLYDDRWQSMCYLCVYLLRKFAWMNSKHTIKTARLYKVALVGTVKFKCTQNSN